MVERHNGIFGGCWRIKFHPERDDHVPGYDGNRVFKKCMVEADIAHVALVERDGEEAIAWVEYGTPAELPDITTVSSTSRIRTSRPTTGYLHLRRQRLRRHGLVTVALEAALDPIA